MRFDLDRDGDLSDPDPGIEGTEIELWTDPNGDGNPNDGMLVGTTTTDAGGYYTFSGLVPGNYVVVEIDFVTFDSTADAVGPNDNRVPVVLPPEGNVGANDFLDAGDELCNDGIDNDFNNAVDCDDSFCKPLQICRNTAPVLSPPMILALIVMLAMVAVWGQLRLAPRKRSD